MTQNTLSLKSPHWNIKSVLKRMTVVILIGILINVLITFWYKDPNAFSAIKEISYPLLFAAGLMALIPLFTHTIRIMLWLKFLNKRIRFLEIFKIALGNEVGAAITPTAMGGGPIKLGMLINAGLSPAQALSVNLLGSLEDATFFLLALPAAFIFSKVWLVPTVKELFNHIYQMGAWLILIAIAVMILLLIFLIVRQKIKTISLPNGNPWFSNIVARIKNNYRDLRTIFKLIGQKGKYLFWGNVGLCAVQWISRYSILTILLKSLNITVDAVLFFALQWIVFTLMNFFPTPGAVGGAEASFMIVYQELIPLSIISTALTGWRFLTFYFLLITALIFFVILELHSWKEEKSAAGLSRTIPQQNDNRTIVPQQSPELIDNFNT